MAVVPFPNLPPQGPSAGNPWELRSLTGINRSPLNAVATSLERAGAHFALRLPYANLATDRRARLQTFGMSCRGSANRFYVPVFGWTRRGSFPAPELFTNNTFASTTGWTPNNCVLTAQDGALRLTVDAGGIANVQAFQLVTLAQYVPYALRSLVLNGRGTSALNIGPALTDGVTQNQQYDTGRGLKTVTHVSLASGSAAQHPCVFASTTGYTAGDYAEVAHASMARCALVDNGPNQLLHSDSPSNAAWTKGNATGSAVNGTAPDGVGDAEALIENTSVSVHSLSQSYTRPSAIADICAFGYFKRRTGTRDVRLFTGDIAGGNYAGCTFDLNAGTVGSVALTGTATNGRAFIVPVGNFWYYCALVVRTPASTNARVTVEMVNAGTTNYLGDGTSGFYAWRLGGALSSVPTRGMQTTTAGDSDGTLQTGGALYLKGLPASTSGLLLQGDPAEIIIGTTSQLVRTRASLDSDAAGLGYFQFEPPLRVSPLDNAAVIICNPLCKMMMENNVAGWTDRMGGFSDLEFAAVEDTYPS